jgi:hypothetical protein
MPPTPRSRYALALTPILVILAFGFAGIQLYYALALLRAGNFPFAGIYSLMGIGGIALGIALWRARRKFRPPAD